jgi:phosphoribosylanthranilate isomerase
MKVGVFVDADEDEVLRAMDRVGLDTAQLHGHESPEYCRRLGRHVIKSIGVGSAVPPGLEAFDQDVLILVDAEDPARRGGTGRTANWESARLIAASRRTILAGGLNAENVAVAVESVKPYGVDVSSGVESAPGVKDPGRLKSFFEALNG